MKRINFSSGAPLEELVTPKLNRPTQMVEIELEAFITDENEESRG